MVPIHGTGFFFQYLGHHLPPIPSTITRTKILILYTILLHSMQYILIQKTHKSHLTFGQQKTSNEYYHSNQSPILKFSPSDYLHFLIIFPSADINCFWAIKPFIQPYPNFTMSAILFFWPWKHAKTKICFFDTSCINYSPKVNEKTKHDQNQTNRTLSNSRSHI